MESFKEYVISEFKPSAPGYVAAEFKFTYSNKVKVDKKSMVTIVVNTIRVGVKLFDKDMNVLISKGISFENNVLTKMSKKALVNIAPAELENKFNAALGEISNVIMNEYQEKLDDVQTHIDCLNHYLGREGITPSEFKGERIQIASNSGEVTIPKTKVVYDM